MNKQCPSCGRYLPEYLDGRKVGPLCAVCYWDSHSVNEENRLNFIAVDTVSFAQNKNVSVNRINMIKRRMIHPDSKDGDVVLKDHRGRPTSRSAEDY